MVDTFVASFFKRIPENNKLERIWVLAKVDFKSRYYYHKLGVFWALIRPAIEILVYYSIFTSLFKTDIEHFELYLFSGLLFWYFFVEGTSKGINVLLSKRYLIESVQFNKVDLLISTTLSALMGFLFNFLAYLLISIIVGGFPFFWTMIYFPVLLLITCLMVLGFSLILSTLSIYLKDIQHFWDMIVMAGFWMTPIVYSQEIFLENLPWLLYVNPMAGLVINLHNVLLYGTPPDFQILGYSFALSLVVFFIGLGLFSKFSHKAAEKI